MRYKLPEHINISNSLSNSADPKFLITDSLNEREFYINQTTKIFIEKFSVPKSFKDVTNEIAIEANASFGDIKKLIQPFFQYVKHRHFIVPENYVPEQKQSVPFLNPNAIIDNYKIEEILSVNNNVDTYKAVDLNNENIVIIKLLKQAEKKCSKDFQKEFTFLQTLEATDVSAKAYVLNAKENCTYFVQSFIEGLSLPQFIHRKKNSNVSLILHFISQILFAFKKIHAANIVHGDIHPGNFIVTNDNSIKVIDFGLAIDNNISNNEVVNFGGAYFFMPPERINATTRNKFTRKPDFFSDVFQLGVVLYILLYNDYPFNGITWEELATEIKTRQIEFPSASQY